MLEARQPRRREGAGYTCGRPGEHRAYRSRRDRTGSRAAAVALDDAQAADTGPPQLLLELAQVAADHRRHEGVDRRRARSLVLAVLGYELGGDRHLEAAPAGRLSDPHLMGWVEI